jgi:hypothetical protein
MLMAMAERVRKAPRDSSLDPRTAPPGFGAFESQSRKSMGVRQFMRLGFALAAVGLGLLSAIETTGALPPVASNARSSPKGPILDLDPLSLSEFNSAQETYCNALLQSLNEPIDWHVVVDISGSYKSSFEQTSTTVYHLIRWLPLKRDDSLSLDTFGDSYQPETRPHNLNQSRIEVLSGSVEEIESWLLPTLSKLQQEPVQRRTNLQGLIKLLEDSVHPYCAKGAARRYYVVLTDGINEPPGATGMVPLFGAANSTPTFLSKVTSFVTRPLPSSNRAPGLAFVIDQRFTRDKEKREAAYLDWLLGMGQVQATNALEDDSFLRPQVTIWRLPGDERFFDQPTRLALARESGILPCITTAGAQLLTANGRAYEQAASRADNGLLDASRAGSLLLNLPDDILDGSSEEIWLPLEFVTFGKADGELFGEVRGNTPLEGIHSDRISLARPGDPASGWTAYPIKFRIPISEAGMAAHPLPWTAGFSLVDKNGVRPVLALTLDAPQGVSYSLGRFLRHAWTLRGMRGRLMAFWALLFIIIGLILIHIRANDLKIGVKIFDDAHDADMSGTIEMQRFTNLKHHKHCRYRIGHKKMTMVRRQDGPGLQGSSDEIELDVVPIFGMVYHILYYNDDKLMVPEHECREDRPDHLSFKHRSGCYGLLYRPRTFWRIQKGWRSYLWKAWVCSPVKGGERIEGDSDSPVAEHSTFPRRFRIETLVSETSRSVWFRRFAGLLISAAFASAVIACIESRSVRYLNPRQLWTWWAALFLANVCYGLILQVCSYRGRGLAVCLRLRNFSSVVVAAVLVIGCLFPFISSEAVRFSIVLVISLFCLAVSLLYNHMLKVRVENQERVDAWELGCELFLQFSPHLL